MIRQRYLLTPFGETDDKKILQSDWTQLATLSLKWYSHMLFFGDTINAKNLGDQLIHSRDIEDQIILQSH